MARWGLLLGGLIVWAVHFGGLYALGSLEAIAPANGVWRAAILALSLTCLAATAAVAAAALQAEKRPGPDPEPGRFVSQLAAAGAGLAALAIVWQTTAAMVAE